jgi:hypothetical protein
VVVVHDGGYDQPACCSLDVDDIDLSAEQVPNIYNISGVLSHYLRSQPEGLVPFSLYRPLLTIVGMCQAILPHQLDRLGLHSHLYGCCLLFGLLGCWSIVEIHKDEPDRMLHGLLTIIKNLPPENKPILRKIWLLVGELLAHRHVTKMDEHNLRYRIGYQALCCL